MDKNLNKKGLNSTRVLIPLTLKPASLCPCPCPVRLLVCLLRLVFHLPLARPLPVKTNTLAGLLDSWWGSALASVVRWNVMDLFSPDVKTLKPPKLNQLDHQPKPTLRCAGDTRKLVSGRKTCFRTATLPKNN